MSLRVQVDWWNSGVQVLDLRSEVEEPRIFKKSAAPA